MVLGAAASADAGYNGLNPADIVLSNADDDLFNTVVVTTTADGAAANDGDTSSLAALWQNKGSDGQISLREAFIAANNTANAVGGADHISFNISAPLVGGAHTIALLSELPALTGAVVIDGSTEPDFAGTPVVELDGSAAGVGGPGRDARGRLRRQHGARPRDQPLRRKRRAHRRGQRRQHRGRQPHRHRCEWHTRARQTAARAFPWPAPTT